jgi:WD40 repeat protein
MRIEGGEPIVLDVPPIEGDPATDLRWLALAPDGKTVAISTKESRHLGVLDLDRGDWRWVQTVDAKHFVDHLQFSADGTQLHGATGWWDRGDRNIAWSAADGRVLAQTAVVRNAGFDLSPDGTSLVTATRSGVQLFDAETFSFSREVDLARRGIHGPSFSPDGRRIVVAGHDGSTWLIDADTWESKRIPGKGGAGIPIWSPDGALLVDSREDRRVRVLDGRTGAVVFTLPERRRNNALFVTDTELWVQSDERTVRTWSFEGWRNAMGGVGRPGIGPGLALSPDGEHLATTSHVDGHLRVWEATTGKLLLDLEGRSGFPRWSADGRSLLATHDGEIVRFDAESLERRDGFAHVPKYFTLLDDAGDRVGVCPAEGLVEVYTTATGEHEKDVQIPGENPWPRQFADARVVTFGEKRSLIVFDIDTEQVEARADLDHEEEGLHVSAGGHHAIVGFRDGHAAVFELPELALLREWKAHEGRCNRFGVSDDGHWAATASGASNIHLWSLPDGELQATMTGHDQRVLTATFAPSGSYFLSTDSDGLILPWDLQRADQNAAALLQEAQERFGCTVKGSRIIPMGSDRPDGL